MRECPNCRSQISAMSLVQFSTVSKMSCPKCHIALQFVGYANWIVLTALFVTSALVYRQVNGNLVSLIVVIPIAFGFWIFRNFVARIEVVR